MVNVKGKRNSRRMARGLRKRWYVDAAIPKSVPVIGGTRFAAGTGSLAKRSVQAMVRQTVRAAEPQKYKIVDLTLLDMTANTLYTWNPLGNIPIGTGENQRLATDIFVKKMTARFLFQVNGGLATGQLQQPVNVRVMWVRSNAQYGSGVDTFASGLGISDLFYAGQTIPMRAYVDHGKVTVLADHVYQVRNPGFASGWNSQFIESSCPVGKGIPFQYSALTGNYSTKMKNVYCVISAQVPSDITGTTVDCKLEYSTLVEYVDSR